MKKYDFKAINLNPWLEEVVDQLGFKQPTPQ